MHINIYCPGIEDFKSPSCTGWRPWGNKNALKIRKYIDIKHEPKQKRKILVSRYWGFMLLLCMLHFVAWLCIHVSVGVLCTVLYSCRLFWNRTWRTPAPGLLLPKHHLHRTHLVPLPPLSSPPWTTASRPLRSRQRKRWIGYVVIHISCLSCFIQSYSADCGVS